MTYFTLKLNADHLPHYDLILDIPSINFSQPMDTYYYWLDKNISDDVEDKGKAVLISMLKQWKLMVSGLKVRDTCFFPLDLSDEYIGFFKVELLKDDELIELTYGYTQKIMGMEISPSQTEQFIITNNDFEPDALPVLLTMSELIATIDINLEALS